MAGSETKNVAQETTIPDLPCVRPRYGARISRVLRTEGFTGIIAHAARKGLFMLWRHSSAWWYERDLTQPIMLVEWPPSASIDVDGGARTWEWIVDHLRSGTLSRVEKKEYNVDTLSDHMFPLIKYNNEPVGYIKIGAGNVFLGDFERVFCLPEGDAIIYDSYVDPDFRGKCLAPVAVTEVMLALRKRGYRRLLCHIPEWNVASHNFVLKCGFVKKNKICYCRMLGFRFMSHNPFETEFPLE